jgi:hypothetical protein
MILFASFLILTTVFKPGLQPGQFFLRTGFNIYDYAHLFQVTTALNFGCRISDFGGKGRFNLMDVVSFAPCLLYAFV